MAKLTDNVKALIVADYHTNKFSQRELAKKYDVSLGTVNKITKEIEPENEHLVNAQASILSARALLPPEQMNAIMNAAQEELYNKGLVTNATQLNIVRVMEHLSNNKKLEKVGMGQGIQDFREVGLGSDDYKQCQDALDKASITLGVNQRHANAQTNINNTNSQQNIDNTVEIKFTKV